MVRIGLILLWLLGAPLAALTLTYHESTGGKTAVHVYTVRAEGTGWRITLVRSEAGGELQDEVLTDASLSTLEWRFVRRGDDTEVFARRNGRVIELNGRHRGKPIRKSFTVDDSPWKQLFSIDFEPLLRTTKGRFWAIGTSGAGEMKITDFSYAVKDEESIVWQGRQVAAVRLRIRLAGMLSMFWHGDYWFRRDDSRYLRYRGKNGLIAGDTVKELQREE